MRDNSKDNKRLAKNTLFLYFRMFLIMAVSFYATRVILLELGVVDYGIYNAIGGIVMLFSFINNALVTATQRYLSYYYGKRNVRMAGSYFCACLLAFIVFGIIITLLTEISGLWFIHNKMDFPIERMNAVIWTLHISVMINFVTIVRSAYHACVIANEKFNFYAYLSIVESVLKLLIIYIISISVLDKLIFYNLLLLFVTVIVFLFYYFYCYFKYHESRFVFNKDKHIYKEVLSFSGYSLLGNAANVFSQQGIALLLNVFCGVAVNAAVGIAHQVSAGVFSFVSNFQTAFNPQLVKIYAKGDLDYLRDTVCMVSKYSFLLLSIIVVPIICCSSEILIWWLKEVPIYTSEFCILTVFFMLIDSLAAPLWITIQATGKIKKYQIITSLIIIANIPISYFFLHYECSPIIVFVLKIIINMIAYIFRLYYTNTLIHINYVVYFRKTILPLFRCILPVIGIWFILSWFNINKILSVFVIEISIMILIFFLALSRNEKQFIFQFIIRKK